MGTRIQAATTIVVTVAACMTSAAVYSQLTVVESDGGGPTPADLVSAILDAGSAYSLVPGSVSTAIDTSSGSYTTSLRALGAFSGGLTPAGTLLPWANQNAAGDAVYAGGVGIGSGICLCTGAASDTDAGGSLDPGFGIGAEGPNNGYRGSSTVNSGEICTGVLGEGVIDRDFDEHVFGGQLMADPNFHYTGDPTVLQFRITLQNPGFLRLRWVFASDEYPDWLDEDYNDAFAILIKKDACQGAGFENVAVFKEPGNPNLQPFRLISLVDCGAPVFRQNQLSPAPSEFLVSHHAIDDTPGEAPYEYDTSIPYFDHEFGGFSGPRTSETSTALSPGSYTVKIVIHDVKDAIVDSALFLQGNSLKLFPLNPGDYNGDGCVDEMDFVVLSQHFGQTPATFFDGDGNGDCIIDIADYTVWRDHCGESGNADFSADFNRDGCVDGDDFLILQGHYGMQHCASRFEGDANGDGAVDGSDLDVWREQFGSCGCEQGAMSSALITWMDEQLMERPEIMVTAALAALAAGTDYDAVVGETGSSSDAPTPDLAIP